MKAAAGRRSLPVGAISLLLLLILIGLVAFHRAGRNDNPEELDQGAYLHVSLLIHEHRAMTDGNRHPLYPALLAPFASREHSFFPTAKLVTLGLGMAGYLFVTWRVARRWGTGIAFAVLLACGSSFVWTASGLRCEVLLIPLLWVFWESGAAGFETPGMWIVAGCAAGLVYLTKASGTLLVVALVATWLFGGQLRDRRRWNLLLFLVPFALVVSPLALWNYRMHGSAFYNINSKHVMWLDSWQEAGRVHTPLPTMRSWFSEHGIGDLIAREFTGILRLPDLWLFVLFFLAVAALIAPRATGARGAPRRYGVKLAASFVAIHAVLLAWYAPIVSSSRFVIPMQPVMWSVVLLATVDRVPEGWIVAAGRLRVPLTILIAAVLMMSPLLLDLHDPYDDPIVTYPEIEDWIRSADETSLVYGPSQNFPQWIFIPDFRFVAVPPDVSFSEMSDRMQQQGTRFLLVDREMLQKRPVLGRLAVDRPGVGLEPVPGSEAFVVSESDLGAPVRWILFERTNGSPTCTSSR